MRIGYTPPRTVRPAPKPPLRTVIGPVATPPRPSAGAAAGGGAGGGGGGAGGGTPAGPPDYLALLKATPGYQSWFANKNTREANLATDRAAAIRALALQYGGLPKGFQDSYGDLRPEDLANEQGNQFSVQQQLARQDASSREAMHRSLAARGMLQSGDLGYGEGQADLAKGNAEYDAGNQFLAALSGAISGYTGGVGNIEGEESGIINQLLPLMYQLYPYTPPAATPPPPSTPPPYVPPSQTPYKPPGYVSVIRPRPGQGGVGGGGQVL